MLNWNQRSQNTKHFIKITRFKYGDLTGKVNTFPQPRAFKLLLDLTTWIKSKFG
jgi:hypothetical protein